MCDTSDTHHSSRPSQDQEAAGYSELVAFRRKFRLVNSDADSKFAVVTCAALHCVCSSSF